MFNRTMILSYQQPLSPKESLKHRFHEKCMKALSTGNFKASCANACLLFWIVLEIQNANSRNEAKCKNATRLWLAKVKTPSMSMELESRVVMKGSELLSKTVLIMLYYFSQV